MTEASSATGRGSVRKLTYFLVPETKGRSLEDIESDLALGATDKS